jgi:hypothetical protein
MVVELPRMGCGHVKQETHELGLSPNPLSPPFNIYALYIILTRFVKTSKKCGALAIEPFQVIPTPISHGVKSHELQNILTYHQMIGCHVVAHA